MNLRKIIICSLMILFTGALHGQDLHLDSYLEKDRVEINELHGLQQQSKSLSFRAPQSSLAPALVSPVYLPEFARKNPTGYTYLCRLELKIEKDLPLGLWLDIGDNSTTGNPSNANANVRFRFKLK